MENKDTVIEAAIWSAVMGTMLSVGIIAALLGAVLHIPPFFMAMIGFTGGYFGYTPVRNYFSSRFYK